MIDQSQIQFGERQPKKITCISHEDMRNPDLLVTGKRSEENLLHTNFVHNRVE